MFEVVEIDSCNTQLVVDFLKHAGDSLRTFRYFDNRSMDCLNNHLFTVVFCHDKEPIAYGHLEQREQETRLGIAVAQQWLSRGIGKKMMEVLISKANVLQLPEIHLTVDHDNKTAIKLYKKFGFSELEATDEYRHFLLKL